MTSVYWAFYITASAIGWALNIAGFFVSQHAHRTAKAASACYDRAVAATSSVETVDAVVGHVAVAERLYDSSFADFALGRRLTRTALVIFGTLIVVSSVRFVGLA